MTSENNLEFFAWLKKESEKVWENAPLNENVYGFQTQAGTKWLPGLTQDEINHFEEEIGFSFPQVYREILTCMNGTDKDAVNVYANSGLPYVYNSGYYSYPRDLEQVRGLIHWIYEAFSIDEAYVVINKHSS